MHAQSNFFLRQMKKSEGEDLVFSVKYWHRRSREGLIESAAPCHDTKVMGVERGSNCIRLTVLAAKSDDYTIVSRHSYVNNGLVHQYLHETILERYQINMAVKPHFCHYFRSLSILNHCGLQIDILCVLILANECNKQ